MSDLVLAISRALDQVRAGIREPVFAPLEALLPAEWCDGWMFMDAHEATIMPAGLVVLRPETDRSSWDRRVIFNYKHGITRRYLFIGEDMNTYCYRAEHYVDPTQIGDPVYSPIAVNRAVDIAYNNIESFGATRETPYDAEFIANRNRLLVEAGYTVVS